MPEPIRKLMVFLAMLLVCGLLIYGIKLALPLLQLGEPANTIVLIMLAVVIICTLCYYLGIFKGGPPGPL